MEHETVFVGNHFHIVENQAAVDVNALFTENIQHAFGAELAFLFAVSLQDGLQFSSFGETHLVAKLGDDFVHGSTTALAGKAEGVILVTANDGVVDGAVCTLLHILGLGSTILMDTAAMYDSFGTNERSAGINANAGPLGNQDSGFVNLVQVQAGIYAGIVQAQSHFVEVGITATFAKAV